MSELTKDLRPLLILDEFRARAKVAEDTQNKEEIDFLNLNILTIYASITKILHSRVDTRNGGDLLLYIDSCYTQVLCHLMREGLIDLDKHCEDLKEEVYKHSKLQNITAKAFKEIDEIYQKHGLPPGSYL